MTSTIKLICTIVTVVLAMIATIFGYYKYTHLDVFIVVLHNNEAVQGVTVKISQQLGNDDVWEAKTDRRGKASFDDLRKGDYYYAVCYKGCPAYPLGVHGKNDVYDTIRIATPRKADTIATIQASRKPVASLILTEKSHRDGFRRQTTQYPQNHLDKYAKVTFKSMNTTYPFSLFLDGGFTGSMNFEDREGNWTFTRSFQLRVGTRHYYSFFSAPIEQNKHYFTVRGNNPNIIRLYYRKYISNTVDYSKPPF